MSNTKQTKHTPGPWIVIDHYEPNRILVNAGVYPDATAIAEIISAGSTKRANARLIAAAPDLLDVVQLIIKEWEKPTEGVQVGELIARLSQYSVEARAAIAKATGGGAK